MAITPLTLRPLRLPSLGGQPSQPPMSEQERRSLLAELGTKTLSGLSRAANLLDVPGSMVRDVVTGISRGEWVNPFDQLLTPFGPQNRTTGREMLESFGMAPNRPGLDWGDVGGFAAEMATDPFFWASPFGLTRQAGRAAKATGLLEEPLKQAAKGLSRTAGRRVGLREAKMTLTPNDLFRLADNPALAEARFLEAGGTAASKSQPIGGLVGLGPLGSTKLGQAVGTGKISQAIARKADVGARAIRSALPVRLGYQTFAAKVKGQRPMELQETAERITNLQRQGRTKNLETMLEEVRQMRDQGLVSPDDWREMRTAIEVPGAARTLLQREVRTRYLARNAQDLADNAHMGIKPQQALDDVIERVARQTHAIPGAKTPRGKGHFDVTSKWAKNRNILLQGFRRGTHEGVDEVFMNPQITAIANQVESGAITRDAGIQQIERFIETTYGGPPGVAPIEKWYHAQSAKGGYRYVDQVTGQRVTLSKLPSGSAPGARVTRTLPSGRVQTLQPAFDNRYKGLAEMTLDWKEAREHGVFGPDWIAHTHASLDSASDRRSIAQGIYETLASTRKAPASPIRDRSVTKVGQILQDIGLDTNTGAQRILEQMGVPAAHINQGTMRALKNMTVPKDIADGLTAMWPAFKAPPEINTLAQAARNLTALFKVGVLTWPARYVRDLISGAARSVEMGIWGPRSAYQSHGLLQGKAVAGLTEIPEVQRWLATRGLPATDKNASDAVRFLYAQHRGAASRVETDVPGAVGTGGFEMLSDLLGPRTPGNIPKSAAKVAKTAAGFGPGVRRAAFWDIRGVGGRKESAWGVARAGDMVGRYTDDMNRMTPFLHQIKRGVAPEEAMRVIRIGQVDYDPETYTPTEQQLKLLFPFYSFSSRQIPYIVKTLATNPGGGLGQTLRGYSSLRGDTEFLPQYLAETMAVPIPDNAFTRGIGIAPKKGAADPRYLTSSGMFMGEDFFRGLGGGPELISKDFPWLNLFSGKAAGTETLGRMNPLLQPLISIPTGQAFFQNRELADVDPTLGRTLANIKELTTGVKSPRTVAPVFGRTFETLLAGSPLSRAVSSARTATDPRKSWGTRAWNLLTGARLSDIPQRTRDAVLRDLRNKLMAEMGAKGYEISYFPEELLLSMPPEMRRKARQLQALKGVMQ